MRPKSIWGQDFGRLKRSLLGNNCFSFIRTRQVNIVQSYSALLIMKDFINIIQKLKMQTKPRNKIVNLSVFLIIAIVVSLLKNF